MPISPGLLVKGCDWVSQNRALPCSRRFRAGIFRKIPAWKFGLAPVLKKVLTNALPCAIIPKLKEKHLYRGVEQLAARRAHNPEVGGSSPPSATMLCNQKRYCTGKPRSRNGFWVFSYPEFQVQTKRYFLLLRGFELPTPSISGGF